MKPYQRECDYCGSPIEMQHIRKSDGSYKWIPKTIEKSHPEELWEQHTCLQNRWGKNHFSSLKQSLEEKGYSEPKSENLFWNLTDSNLADLLNGKRISLSYTYPDGKKTFLVLKLVRQPFINSENNNTIQE